MDRQKSIQDSNSMMMYYNCVHYLLVSQNKHHGIYSTDHD